MHISCTLRLADCFWLAVYPAAGSCRVPHGALAENTHVCPSVCLRFCLVRSDPLLCHWTFGLVFGLGFGPTSASLFSASVLLLSSHPSIHHSVHPPLRFIVPSFALSVHPYFEMPPTLTLKRHDYEDTLSMANLKEATSAIKLSPGAAHSTSSLAGRKHASTPPPPNNPARSWNRSHAVMQAHGTKLFKNAENAEELHEPMEWTNEWDHGHRDTTTTTHGERAAALWDKVGGGSGSVQAVAHGLEGGSLDSVATNIPGDQHTHGASSTGMSNRGAHSQRGGDRLPSHKQGIQGMHRLRGGHQRRRSVLDDIDREALNVCEFIEGDFSF